LLAQPQAAAYTAHHENGGSGALEEPQAADRSATARGAEIGGDVPDRIVDFVITPHAEFELRRRGLDEALVRRVLAAPEQRAAVRPGRDVLQSRIEIDDKVYLVRVIVDVDRNPAEIVTGYRTSKIDKYWRSEP
jgi:hypothetical protein